MRNEKYNLEIYLSYYLAFKLAMITLKEKVVVSFY